MRLWQKALKQGTINTKSGDKTLPLGTSKEAIVVVARWANFLEKLFQLVCLLAKQKKMAIAAIYCHYFIIAISIHTEKKIFQSVKNLVINRIIKK